ncbi:g6952 [Coccomyxa elongata]
MGDWLLHYTPVALESNLLDNKGLPNNITPGKLEAAHKSILKFFEKLRALPQLSGARTGADIRAQEKKAAMCTLEPSLATSVADLSCIPEDTAALTPQAVPTAKPTAAVDQAVRPLADHNSNSGVQTREMRRLPGAQAASVPPQPAVSLEQLNVVPAHEKLSEQHHMQLQVFELLLRINMAVEGVLHLADTDAENGFAGPPAFIGCSGLATRLRAWVQLVLPVEFRLDDMQAALGQLIGRFQVAAEQQGRGSSSLSQLGYILHDVPKTVSCISELDPPAIVTASVDGLLRIGSAERVFAAHLPDGSACVVKLSISSREVDILRKLAPGHPHSVCLVGSLTAETGTWVLLSPFAQPLNHHTDTDLIIQVTYDVTTALEFLQSKGVLHGDVSPENIGSVGGRGVLFNFSSSKDTSSPVKERDSLSFVTGPPVAASLGRLRGGDAGITDDLESLFLSMYYILIGGKMFGHHFFFSGDIESMCLARTGVMFIPELDKVDIIREARSKAFVVDLFRVFFPINQLGNVQYRRDVRAEEVKGVCRKHFLGLLK